MRRKFPSSCRKRRRRFQFEALESRRLLAAELDYGDAPDLGPGFGPGNYATLLGDNGPSHIVSASLYIGTQRDGQPNGVPDAEDDAQPNIAADGDD